MPDTPVIPDATKTPIGGQPATARPTGKRKMLSQYGERIKVSKKWREEEKYEDTWSRMRDLYRNKHFEGGSSEDRIAVNVAFSTVNTIVPSVAVNHPQITVNARQEMLQPQAEVAEAMLNYWWRHYNWRVEIKRATKDSLITGNGWVKVGWKYETAEVPLTAEEQFQQLQAAKEAAGLQAEQDPASADQLPSDEELQASLPTTRQEVVKDCPFVERVSPFDIFIDPEATCIEDMKWIAQRLIVPLEDVRKDRRYRQSARQRVQADTSLNVRWRDDKDSPNRGSSSKYSDDVQRCTLWEFYDMRAKTYCVFAEGADDYLIEPTNFPYPYGHPFVPLGNYDVPDQFYCMGDLEAIEPLQHELNGVRSDMVNHRKRYQRAYLVNRDAFDQTAQNALLSDVDNRIIPIEGDHDLSNVLVPLQQLPLDPQMYQHSQQIESDIDLVSGVSEYQRGSMSEIRRTATEAAMIQDASNARSADKLAQIEDFMAEIAERVLQLAQQMLTGEYAARVVGPDGQAIWTTFSIDQIQGEFDFEVEAGSTQPKDETFRRQQALQLMNVMGQFIGVGVIRPDALAAYVLREGFGIKNVDQFILSQEEQMMQQMMAAQQQGGQSDQGGGSKPPKGAGPNDKPQEANTLPTSGPQSIPPELLLQLQNQVGLNLPTMGGQGG